MTSEVIFTLALTYWTIAISYLMIRDALRMRKIRKELEKRRGL